MIEIRALLPIGSVVALQDAERKLMIIGLKQRSDTEDREYDYAGVLFPEGNLGPGTQLLFDHENIRAVVFRGYENEETESFLSRLDAYYAQKAMASDEAE